MNRVRNLFSRANDFHRRYEDQIVLSGMVIGANMGGIWMGQNSNNNIPLTLAATGICGLFGFVAACSATMIPIATVSILPMLTVNYYYSKDQ